MKIESFKHYRLGLEEIDKQHWELFEILNKMTISLPDSEIVELASTLNKLWFEHNITEESLMEEINFPYINAHKSSHEKMNIEFKKFMSKFESDKKYTMEYYKEDLEKMMINHVDIMDSQYGVWAKKVKHQSAS